MDDALSRGEAGSFFLATDDPAEWERIGSSFPGRILNRPPQNLVRRDAAAAEDAVIDMFCLARMKRLIGSHWSSFSEVAAELGGLRLTVARDDGAPSS